MTGKHLALARFALGSLRRRALRSGTLIAAIAMVTFLFASSVFLRDALMLEVESFSQEMPDLVVQRLVAGRPAMIEEAAAAVLGEEPGATAEPRVWGYLEVGALEANIVVVGVSSEVLRSLGGSNATADTEEQCKAVAGTAISARLGLRGDDHLALTNPAGVASHLLVTAVRPRDTSLQDADVLYVETRCARELLMIPPQMATDLAVTLSQSDEAAPVTERLLEAIPGARVVDKRSMHRLYRLTFEGRGGLMNALFLPCLALLLLLAWERLTSVGEKEREEIRLLKSLSWRTSDVLVTRLHESLWIASFGVMTGFVLAYLHVFFFEAALLAGVLFGWSELVPPLVLTPATGFGALLTIAGVVLGPFVALSVFPAWRAAVEDR